MALSLFANIGNAELYTTLISALFEKFPTKMACHTYPSKRSTDLDNMLIIVCTNTISMSFSVYIYNIISISVEIGSQCVASQSLMVRQLLVFCPGRGGVWR